MIFVENVKKLQTLFNVNCKHVQKVILMQPKEATSLNHSLFLVDVMDC